MPMAVVHQTTKMKILKMFLILEAVAAAAAATNLISSVPRTVSSSSHTAMTGALTTKNRKGWFFACVAPPFSCHKNNIWGIDDPSCHQFSHFVLEWGSGVTWACQWKLWNFYGVYESFNAEYGRIKDTECRRSRIKSVCNNLFIVMGTSVCLVLVLLLLGGNAAFVPKMLSSGWSQHCFSWIILGSKWTVCLFRQLWWQSYI